MRDLVIKRVTETVTEMTNDGYDPLEEIDLTIDDVAILTDEKLLDLYTDLTGFRG